MKPDLNSPFSPTSVARDFVAQLRWHAAESPNDTAYIYLADGEDDQVVMTYGDLDLRARAIGQLLMANGMTGHRELLLFPPGLDFVATLFGCFYAGVVAVPAYPPRRNRNMARIQSIAHDAQARMALSVQDHVSRFQKFSAETPELRKLTWLATDAVPNVDADDWQRPDINDDSLAVLQYTSGSTGVPKGVMLTHGNIIHNCYLITTAFEATPNDIGMSWLPTLSRHGAGGRCPQPHVHRLSQHLNVAHSVLAKASPLAAGDYQAPGHYQRRSKFRLRRLH